MPKSRRKSDVHALKSRVAAVAGVDGWKKSFKSNNNRRKTIAAPSLPHGNNMSSIQSDHVASSKDDKENERTYNFRHHDDGNDDQTVTSHVSKRSTSSKTSHNNRGGDAGYFYKNLPTTPLHKLFASAKKKHHLTASIASTTTANRHNTSYLSNSSESSAGDINLQNDSMDSSTDRAMWDLKSTLDASPIAQDDTSDGKVSPNSNKSIRSKASERSSEKSSTTTTSSSNSSGAMNRSILSDTTELTASNFVFQATSKRKVLDAARSAEKKKQQQAAVAAREALPLQEVHLEDIVVDEDLTEQTNIVGLFQRSQQSQQQQQEKPIDNISAAADKDAVESGVDSSRNQDIANTSITMGSRPTLLLTGPSPSSVKKRIQISPRSLRKFTDSLKRTRVQRQMGRDQDIRKRLSMGSARKQQPLPPSMRSETVSQLFLGHAAIAGRASLGSVAAKPSQAPLTSTRSQLANSPTPSENGIDNKNFVSQIKPLAAEPESSPEMSTTRFSCRTDGDDTADVAFEYQQWMRPALETSIMNESTCSSVRAMPNLANTSALDMDNIDKPAGVNLACQDMSAGEVDETSQSEPSQQPTETDPSTVLGENNTSDTSKSPRDGFNLFDEGTPESEGSNEDKVILNSHGHVSRRESATGSVASPASSVSSHLYTTSPTPLETRQSLLVRQASTSASKLTPTRLTKKPRRIVNPNSMLSPAKNTRSACKKKSDASAGANSPLFSPARNTRSASKKASTYLEQSATKNSSKSPASKLTDTSPQLNVAPLNKNEDESSVTSKSVGSSANTTTSRLSGVTADLGDIGDLFDTTSEFKHSGEHQLARNQRRETVSLSDFGDVMDYLNNSEGKKRRSSVTQRGSSRHSGMYRSSLASLPEQSLVDHRNVAVDASVAEDDDEYSATDQDGSNKLTQPTSNLSSPPSARKISTARMVGGSTIDSPARYTRSASKKEAVEIMAASPRDNLAETGDQTATSLDLSGLLDGLQQLSPSSLSASTNNELRLSVSGSATEERHRSRFSLDESEEDRDDEIEDAKTIESMGSVCKSGRSRYSLNSSSSTEDEGEVITKVVDDNKTATLSDLGAVLGTNAKLNDSKADASYHQSNRKRQRDLESPKQKKNIILMKRYEVEDERDTKRQKPFSIAVAEVSESTNVLASIDTDERGEEERSSLAALEGVHDIPNPYDSNTSDVASLPAAVSEETQKDDDIEEDDSQETPEQSRLAVNDSFVPRSALKRTGAPTYSEKKSVNFKSPQAAEFMIGSRTSNMTPMSKKKAKELFKIPMTNEERANNGSCDMSVSSNSSTLSATSILSPAKASAEEILAMKENTVTLEINMDQLMNNLEDHLQDDANADKVGEPTGTSLVGPIVASEEATVELESNVLGLLANTLDVTDTQGASGLSVLSKESSTDTSLHSEYKRGSTDATVELENNFSGLLANMAHEDATTTQNLDDREESKTNETSSLESSETMTDAASIASANACGDIAATGEPQRLNFSSPTTTNSSQHSASHEDTDEYTMQLEGNMTDLIEAVGSRSEEQNQELDQLDMSVIPHSSPSEQGTPSFQQESSMSQSTLGNSPSTVSEKPENNEGTIQLESNVQQLLVTADFMAESATDHSDIDSMGTKRITRNSFTMQLEENMSDVLRAADSAQQMEEIVLGVGMKDTPGNRSLRSRRSSIASHTFSLACECPSDNDENDEKDSQPEHYDASESRVVKPPTPDNQGVLSRVTLDLTYEELFNVPCLTGFSSNPIPDILGKFSSLPQRAATENLESYLSEACDQLESHIDTLPDSQVEFERCLEEDAAMFLHLQQKLRNVSQESNPMKKRLEELASGASSSNDYAMAVWSKDMLTSIHDVQLPYIIESIQKMTLVLDENIRHLDDTNKVLSSMADADARRARRNSMCRRKTAVSDIEEDMQVLESEIASATRNLEEQQARLRNLTNVQASLVTKVSFQKNFGSLRREAATCAGKYGILSNISKWESGALVVGTDITTMLFKYHGSFPESCASIRFECTGDVIRVRAKTDASAFKSKSAVKRKLSLASSLFLKRKVGQSLSCAQKSQMTNAWNISCMLQELDITISRIESLAIELTAIESKYRSNLLFGGGHEAAIEVEMKGCLATFNLHRSYPFMPTTVLVEVYERDINVRKLQRHLTKRVPVGLEYLSRAIAEMHEFLNLC